MRFEGRELNLWAEPVAVDALRAGEAYFWVAFLDEEMVVPFMEPVVFIGRNLEDGDTDMIYFQDFPSDRQVSATALAGRLTKASTRLSRASRARCSSATRPLTFC